MIIFSANFPLVFKYKFRRTEIQLQPTGDPREHRLGEVLQGRSKSKFNHIIFFSLNLPLVFIFKWHFDKFQNQTPGEPRECNLCEVLQGRSKSKFNIILLAEKLDSLPLIYNYLIRLFCCSGFHNPNYLEIKKNRISKCSKISQLETFKLPEVLVFFQIIHFRPFLFQE